MGNHNTNSRFFDHTLKTTLPKKEKTADVLEIEHDRFMKFKDELTALFPEMTETTAYSLYNKFANRDDSLESASNAYLDNSNNYSNCGFETLNKRDFKSGKGDDMKIAKSTTPIPQKKRSRVNGIDIFVQNHENSSKKQKHVEEYVNKKEPLEWKKYIGTLNVQCWCTRSIFNLGSIYRENRLIFTKSPSNDVIYVSQQAEGSPYKRELGRVVEDISEIIGPLLMENAMEFESKLFYVDTTRLSTGDSFIIRTRCFLRGSIFENETSLGEHDDFVIEQLKVMKDSNGKINAGTRLKSAILKLFKLIELKTDKELEREHLTLIKAGSTHDILSDQNMEKEPIYAGDISTENSDGTELSLNQVKDLYKSTELSVLQEILPESIPDNFNIELRTYQKQGLSWMLQREKEYDNVGLNNVNLENKEKEFIIAKLMALEKSLNPLWKEYTWPPAPENIPQSYEPDNIGDKFYLNMYKGTCSTVKPVINSDCKGGILADEMGLGKTITTLALIFSCPKDRLYESLPNDHMAKVNDYAYQTTLIVVPMALLTQWEKEFTKVNGDAKKNFCYIYYGSGTLGNLKSILCGKNPPRLILTTYGMIQSEWAKSNRVDSRSGLFSVKFFRVILDEGHNIRNKSTKTAKAVNSIRSERNWILTGTPIINRLDDLFSLIQFLRLRPWCYHSLWRHCISVPFETSKDIDVATDLLKSILDPILLRRTKNQRDKDGNFLVTLPSKEVIIEKIKMTKKEQLIYDWLKEKAVSSFKESYRAGLIFKNYTTILTQLLRLRQVCCHVDLIKNTSDTSKEAIVDDDVDVRKNTQSKLINQTNEEVLSLIRTIEMNEKQQRLPLDTINKLKSEIYELYPRLEENECSICTEALDIDTCVVTECKHCFCLGCLMEHFEFQLTHKSGTLEEADENDILANQEQLMKAQEVFCPMCRTQINQNRLLKTLRTSETNTDSLRNLNNDGFLTTQGPVEKRDYFIRPYTPNGQSSKINALLTHLEMIKCQSPGDHVIVFSQFTSFLDLIEEELHKYKNEYKVHKFDGRLNLEQRHRVLNDFEEPVKSGETKVSILLLSLKAGGVGLNLTVASKAFLMDPHWNNAIEFQAIDRIHRVGQCKDVKVVRFITEGSIEERMLQIQEKKNQLGEALTITDEERRKRKLEELQSLFNE